MVIQKKPMCIRNYEAKTHVHEERGGGDDKPRSKLLQQDTKGKTYFWTQHRDSKNKDQFNHIVHPIPKEKTRNLPSRVANSVTERNFLCLGVYKTN